MSKSQKDNTELVKKIVQAGGKQDQNLKETKTLLTTRVDQLTQTVQSLSTTSTSLHDQQQELASLNKQLVIVQEQLHNVQKKVDHLPIWDKLLAQSKQEIVGQIHEEQKQSQEVLAKRLLTELVDNYMQPYTSTTALQLVQ